MLAKLACHCWGDFEFTAWLEVEDRTFRRLPGDALSPRLIKNARSGLGASSVVSATSSSCNTTTARGFVLHTLIVYRLWVIFISLVGLVLVEVSQKVVCTNIM